MTTCAGPIAQYTQDLERAANHVQVSELFEEHRTDALYQLRDRNGLSTIALKTTAFTEDQITKILTYRLGQYLSAGFVDPAMANAAGLAHEPRSAIGPDDIHVIAASSDTCEIVGYVTLRALRGAPDGATLRTRDRPLFPVEQLVGPCVYDRLQTLPELRTTAVRELGRLVKNHGLGKLNPQAIRAPIEVCAAVFRLLIGPLRGEIEALVGDVEERVARRNMEYFHVPLVVLHGVVPYAPEDAFLYGHFSERTCFPFAFLVSDLLRVQHRLESVERALCLPDRSGLAALFALGKDIKYPVSSLLPAGGLPQLSDTTVPQSRVPMAVRRSILEYAEHLRWNTALQNLTAAEAAVLATLTERVKVPPGGYLIHQGSDDDDLFVIESGEAEVRVRGGTPLVLGVRGPGDVVGEISLMTQAPRTADVVALTPMVVFKLSATVYRRYVRQIDEVQAELARTASARMSETLLKLWVNA